MKTLPAIIVGLMFVVLVGLALWCFQLRAELNWAEKTKQNYICIRKSYVVRDIQQYLIDVNQPRYDVGSKGADNIWGRDTKTAVNNFMFDNQARVYFTMGIEK